MRTDAGVERLLRDLAPQALGVVVRRYGHFDAAEDAIQEALLAAATQWPAQGVPDHPKAWLVTVASRRLTDQLRSDEARRRREAAAALAEPPGPPGLGTPAAATQDGERVSGQDDTLTLLFLCCHPELTPASQLALTLRAVGGLTTGEIARAFLVPETTMAQRISRAKQRIAATGARFTPPPAGEWGARLRVVLHVLYLMFNEGYAATSGGPTSRPELTAEAIRLIRGVHRLLPGDGEVAGLLALMLLTEARRPARCLPDGTLVPLAEQDRTRWDSTQIAEGLALVAGALTSAPLGPYQVQAAIAAVHAEAPAAAETDWRQILALYNLLERISPSPVVTLNRAVAVAMVDGPRTALDLLASLEADERMAGHHRLAAVRAHCLELAGDHAAAAAGYAGAARTATSLPERRYLEARAAQLAAAARGQAPRAARDYPAGLSSRPPLSRQAPQEVVMPITPPTASDLASIAQHYGLHLDSEDLESFRMLAIRLLASYDQVERLYEASQPEPPQRPYQWPADDGNDLGAWYVTTEITARRDGPLAGRRVAVKDNIAVAGIPMMNGSRAIEGFIPRRDATVVTRLLDAGATIAGKAVCEDLCFSGGSHTSRTGPVRNPWDRSRTAGGSSSGSAALVAAGRADLALGGDQGGSIRIPSAFCGTVGHKPTHGLVPYTGAFPIENTLDHLGPITRTVRDAALMLGVLAGPDGLDPRQRAAAPPLDFTSALDAGVQGLRAGVLAEGFGFPGLSEPAVDETVRAAIGTLAGAGAQISPVSIPWHRDAMSVWNVIATDGVVTQMVDGNGFGMNWPGRYDPDLLAHYARGRREHADDLPETVKATMFAGRYAIDRYHGRYYAMARELAQQLAAAYDAALADTDVLVMPTLPIVATRLPPAGVTREESIARSTEMIVNTAPFDVTGHPAISVPAGLAGGLPAGLMIVGRHFGDATCLRAAQAFETAVGGFPTPPDA